MEPAAGQVTRVKATVHVAIEDHDRREPIVREVPGGDFDVTERGIMLGTLFIPWHRVIRYGWDLRQEFTPAAGGLRARSEIRIRADDGATGGATYTVPADRFETDAWTVSFLLDRLVEPEEGSMILEKVFIPWSRVVEYERLHVGEAGLPEPPSRGPA